MWSKVKKLFQRKLRLADLLDLAAQECLRWGDAKVIIKKPTANVTLEMHSITVEMIDYESKDATGVTVTLASMPNAVDVTRNGTVFPSCTYRGTYGDLRSLVLITRTGEKSGPPRTIATVGSYLTQTLHYDIPEEVLHILFELYRSAYPSKSFSRE